MKAKANKILMKNVTIWKVSKGTWLAHGTDANGCDWEICEAETKAECLVLARKAVKRFNAEEAQKAQEAEAPATETTPATEQTQEIPTQEEQTTEATQTVPAQETSEVLTDIELKLVTSDLINEGWSSEDGEEIKKEFNLTDSQLERVIAQMKAQEEGNAPTYTDADAQSIAASLIDGGWSSSDAEEIQEAYNLSDDQLRQVAEAMQAYEQEAKAERINTIIGDLNNLEEELLEVAEEIAEDCEAEGYPTHGTTFELRYEQEKARVNTKIDILLEEAESLGNIKYSEGVWRAEEDKEMRKEIILIEDNRQDCDSYEYITYSIALGDMEIGTISIMESEEEPQHLERIDIDEEYRGQGYGTQALKELKGLYDEYTVAPDNEDAARLYARLGEEYSAESANFLDEGFGVYLI